MIRRDDPSFDLRGVHRSRCQFLRCHSARCDVVCQNGRGGDFVRGNGSGYDSVRRNTALRQRSAVDGTLRELRRAIGIIDGKNKRLLAAHDDKPLNGQRARGDAVGGQFDDLGVGDGSVGDLEPCPQRPAGSTPW